MIFYTSLTGFCFCLFFIFFCHVAWLFSARSTLRLVDGRSSRHRRSICTCRPICPLCDRQRF